MKKVLLLVIYFLGFQIVSNAQAQNLAGNYTATGYFYHPSAPRYINQQITITKIKSNTYQMDIGDLGVSGYSFQFDIDANNKLVNWVAVGSAPPAPASNFMTADNPGNFSFYPGSVPGFLHNTYNNRYDPATRTFYMHYGYQPGATSQNQFQRMIYEKLTFIPGTGQVKINSFSPISGSYGTLVTIKGSNFTNTNTYSGVMFGNQFTGNSDSLIVLSDSVINTWVGYGSSGKVYVNNGNSVDSMSGFTYTAPVVNNTQWKYLGLPGFSAGVAGNPNLAISPNNTAAVVFVDMANGLKTTVKQYVGNSWTSMGAPVSEGKSSNPVIAFDNNNVPYVAFIDSLNSSNITVKKVNGNAWITVGTNGFAPSTGTSNGLDISWLAIDGNNIPYVLAGNTVTGGMNLTVYKFNGSSWTSLGLAGVSLYGSACLAINKSNNYPYIVFDDSNQVSSTSNVQATVKYYNGNSWVVVGNAGFSTGAFGVYYTALTFDSNNNPVVALQEDDGFERISVYKLINGTWNSNGSSKISKGHSYYVSLDVDQNNNPVFGYFDASFNRMGSVMNIDNSGWHFTGSRGFLPANTLSKNSLKVNKLNVPLIVFQDANNGYKASVMMLNTPVSIIPPIINTITPASGPVGTLVTITGTNLTNPTAITVGGVAAIPISNTGTSLVAMVMPGSVTGAVTVTTAGGKVTGPNFTVTPTKYPSVQQGGKLVGTTIIGKSDQGYSLSVSADGNTAIVGGNWDNNYLGAAWVFIRTGNVWAQQGNKLVGTGYIGAAYQGNAVAISADGNTAIIGGPGDNGGQGAIWVFTRSGSVWTQQGNKLVGTGNIGNANQGTSLSVSADGNTIITGGNMDNNNQGAAWVFTRNGTVWTQQGNKLTGTGSIGAANQGIAVSMSADGNTAIVGGNGDKSNQGAVWIYSRTGNVWSQQGTKLVGSGNSGAAYQGSSVAISADGNTVIEGGYWDNSNMGAAWIFTSNGSIWAQQGNKLVGSGTAGNSYQGRSVSISADGGTAIIGGVGDNNNMGAAWVYYRTSNTWAQQGNKLTGTGSSGTAGQGVSVALSSDASTAIVGGPNDNNNQGSVWVYTFVNPSFAYTSNLKSFAGCTGTASSSQNFTINGSNLKGNIFITAPAGYELSNSATGKYAATDTLVPVSGTVTTVTVYVRLSSAASGSPAGNITISSSGATTQTIAVSGTVNPLPVVAVTNSRPLSFCSGDSTILSSSVQSGIQWQLNNVNINGTAGNMNNITIKLPGIYKAIVTNSNGCSASSFNDTVTVNVLPAASVITNSRPLIFCNGDSTVLTSSVTSGIQWQINGSNIISATGSKLTAKQSGTYTVVNTNSKGCSTVSAVTIVRNNPIPGAPLINTAGNTTSFCGNSYLVLSSDSVTGNQWYYNGTAVTTARGVNDTARAAGNYAVQYTSSAGCVSPMSTAKTITINTPVAASVSIVSGNTGNICTGSKALFTATAINGGTAPQYQWYKDNKAVGSNTAVYTDSTLTKGDSIWCVLTINAGCVVNATAKSNVLYPVISITPSITIEANSNPVCAGTKVTFTSTMAANYTAPAYTWYKNNHVVGNTPWSGIYSDSLLNNNDSIWCVMYAVNACGTVMNVKSNVLKMTINPLPVAVITSKNKTSFCQGSIDTLVSSSATGNQWLVSGTAIKSANGNMYITGNAGSYTVSVTNANGCTAVSAPMQLIVNTLPATPTITNTRPLSFCNGDSTVLTSSVTTGIQWQLNNANITGATGTKITAKQSGAYTVVTTNSNGCSSVSATTTVKNNPIPGAPLISTAGNATAFCTGSYLVLSSDSTSGNQWYYNGNPITTAKGVNDSARAAGNYALQYTSSAGCISPLSTTKAITVNAIPAIPTISSKGSTSFCQGLYDILSSSSTTGNQWKLNGTAIAKASTLQSFVANIAGNYSVTVTNAAGCTATSAATAITILPTPAKPVITEDANLNLVSSATKGNQWYSPELLTGDTSKVYTPWVNGTYYVQVTVGGCISPMSDAYVYNNSNLNKESLRATGTSTLDSKAIQLYPNPVGNTLKISYQLSGIKDVTVEILDMNGTIIARKESISSGSSFDVSGYASGMYIVRLVNGENQEVLYTTKVVKAK